MKKLISLIVLVMTLGMIGVIAEDQPVDGGVTADLSLILDPASLTFESVPPGTPTVVQQVEITPGTSDVVVTVSVTEGLFDNLMLDLGKGAGFLSIGDEAIYLTAATPDTFDIRLDVPVGYPSGPYTGTITYIATEDI